MDFENQSDKSWSKVLLSRRSSIGCSSRISYYRSSGEGVPFQWEMQPGIAKEPHIEVIPPLTPPPAILSRGFPKPCVLDPEPSTRTSRLKFWKKKVKIGKSKKPHQDDCSNEDFDVFSRLDYSSDSESMVSPRGSSFSSSSSSMSFVKSRPSFQSTCSETESSIYGRRSMNNLGCFPMHFSRILVSIARRD